MIKPFQKYFNALNRLSDFVLIILSVLFALRFSLPGLTVGQYIPATPPSYIWAVALVIGLIGVFVYQLLGVYSALRARPVMQDIGCVLQSNIIICLIALLLGNIVSHPAYIALIPFLILCSISVISKRLVLRFALNTLRRQGYNQKHVLLVGDGLQAQQYCKSNTAHPEYGYTIDGYLGTEDALKEIPYLGNLKALDKLLASIDIDEVIAALDASDFYMLPDVIRTTEKQGVKLSIIPFYNDYISSSVSLAVIGDSKLINVRSIPLDNPMNALIKRTFDVLLSLLLIIVTSPLILIAAIGTALSSPGPILFRQNRIGRNRKQFSMLKFRSMRINTSSDTAWSTDQDPRATRFGQFMRKTSVDELPQFFNVLKGDMSLIGPRPEIPFYVDKFREEIPLYMVKHRVRPGITGWAQINGYRGDTSIAERIRFDLWYIENWSLFLDIRIFFRTVFGGMLNIHKNKDYLQKEKK